VNTATRAGLDFIKAATATDRIAREPALRWRELLQRSTGETRTLLAGLGEALVVHARDEADEAWVAELLRVSSDVPPELIAQTVELAIAERRSRDAMIKAARQREAAA
jgi:hypothetical protein